MARLSAPCVAEKKSQARRSSFCWVWLGAGLPSMAAPSWADRSVHAVVSTPPSRIRTSARTCTAMFCWSGFGANSFQFCSNSGYTHSSIALPCCFVTVLEGARLKKTISRCTQATTAITASASAATTW